MDPIPMRDLAAFAGATEEKHADGPRTANSFFRPHGVCPSSSGELYVADSGNHRIRFINKYGYASTHAGDGKKGFRNGRLESSSFNYPTGITRSPQGHLLISDSGNHVIRIIATQGIVKTYAGTGETGHKDGPAVDATFNAPKDVCIDYQGQLYVCDTGNHRIRMVIASRIVSTVAGSVIGYRDGARDEALFNHPTSVKLTPTRLGTLLIADTGNHCIRLLNNGYITTFAGRCESGFLTGVNKSEALFSAPNSLAVSSDESVYVSDANNHCIYHIASSGEVSLLSGGVPGCQDGSKDQAMFSKPGGICLVAQRQLILAESGHGRILVVKPDGSVANFAGRTRSGTTDGPVAKATFFKPQALFSASSNDLLIADSMGHKIRRIRNGVVTTFAGSPERGFGNGRKDLANFNFPTGICISPSNIVYIADTNNHIIRHITDGIVHTFAGSGVAGWAEGLGEAAQFCSPMGIVLTPNALLVADSGNHRIRIIMKDASVQTFAGSGIPELVDGPITLSSFNTPTDLVYSATDGSVYVSDHLNHAIRVIKPDGQVYTVAGLGTPGYEDGPTSTALLHSPRGLAITPDGRILVAELGNRCIRLIDPVRSVSTFVSASVDTADPDKMPMTKEDIDQLELLPQVPTALSLTNSGVLFISDVLRNQILYLPCPQWDLTRQIPRSKDFGQYFSFSDLSTAPASTFDFKMTHKNSGHIFSLHKFFLQSRCPLLLEQEILEKIESTFSLEALSNLVQLMLSDHIATLTNSSLVFAACELIYLCTLLQKSSWVSLVRYHIVDYLSERLNRLKRRNQPRSPRPEQVSSVDWTKELQQCVDECIDILLHICQHCNCEEVLVDLIVNHIKSFSKSPTSVGSGSRSRSDSSSTTPSTTPSTQTANDPTMISFKFAKPSSAAPRHHHHQQHQQHHHPLQPSFSDSPSPPPRSNPRYSPIPDESELPVFSPDLTRLVVFPSLFETVLTKMATPYVETTLGNTMEHGLMVDMQALFARCNRRRALHSSQSSGDDSSSTTTALSAEVVMAVDGTSPTSISPHSEMDVDGQQAIFATPDMTSTSSLPSVSPLMDPDYALVIGSSRFPCHKNILYARWSHFAELVRRNHPSVAGEYFVLQSNPLTPEIVGGLLRYLYTNEVENLPQTDSFCLGILKSALLYDFVVPGDLSNQPVKGFELLLSFCRNSLMKPLTINNCAPLLNSLFEYGSVTQQNRVISYISRNLKQIMESQEAAVALATVPPALHSKILFAHFSMLQVLEEQ